MAGLKGLSFDVGVARLRVVCWRRPGCDCENGIEKGVVES